MFFRAGRIIAIGGAVASAAACGLTGISRNEGDLRRTVIGAYLARNAGTGVYAIAPHEERGGTRSPGSEILQRLLELAHDGRSGDNDTIVNEAIAAQSGYVCPSYERIDYRWKNCRLGSAARYDWKSILEVRQAAERIGFSCSEPGKGRLECDYSARITQRYVKFSILPSVDGERAGPDRTSQIVARMHFNPRNGATLAVVEKAL